MGCDIHFHVEVKINGQWYHYTTSGLSERNYDLFSKLANVRNDGTVRPIDSPRDLPKDVTFLTKFDSDYWNCDAHSHSWISSTEAVEVEQWAKKTFTPPRNSYSKVWTWEDYLGCYLFGNGFSDFVLYPEDRSDRIAGVEDFRFVFWFDN